MSFESKLQDLIKTSAVNSLDRTLYKQVLGEIQLKSSLKAISEEEEFAVVKRFLKANAEMQSYLDQCHPEYVKCESENALLKSLLPTNLSVEEIEAILLGVQDSILAAKSDNASMGVAMKVLKSQRVDGADVKSVVSKIRSAHPPS